MQFADGKPRAPHPHTPAPRPRAPAQAAVRSSSDKRHKTATCSPKPLAEFVFRLRRAGGNRGPSSPLSTASARGKQGADDSLLGSPQSPPRSLVRSSQRTFSNGRASLRARVLRVRAAQATSRGAYAACRRAITQSRSRARASSRRAQGGTTTSSSQRTTRAHYAATPPYPEPCARARASRHVC